jgi:general secretion pathway protein D
VTFIDVGVKLTVTPTIHKDGYITMKIKPEVSSASTALVTSSKNEIPIVDTSTVDTTIRVKDGVTIVLGGLIKDERSTNSSHEYKQRNTIFYFPNRTYCCWF